MLSVCYVNVKTVLNMCKVEMLSLGYGNIKTRLRQIALLLESTRWRQFTLFDQGLHTYRS